MPTWEEGQEEAQRNSRNRIFGGTRNLGGAVGGTRDMSSTSEGRGSSPFANLRNNRGGSVSGGITPNYGMGGSSRYPQSQFGGAITQNGTGAVTSSAGSRGMRRGGGGGTSVDDSSNSGNITVNFASQDSRSGNISGNVAGAGAVQDNRQDNSTNVDASSRNINGNVGNSLQQDASGGDTRSGASRADGGGGPGGPGGPGGGGGAAGASATTPAPKKERGPTKKEQKHREENPNWKPEDGIPTDEETGKPKWGKGAGNARGPRARGGDGGPGGPGGAGGAGARSGNTGNTGDARGGRNDGSVGGDIDMSSGRRGPSVLDGPPPAGGAQPSTPSGDNNDNSTNVRTGDTGGNNQQVGDNPSTSTTTTTNTNNPPPRDPDSPPSQGDSPRSTERPTPSGDSPERPTISMTDPGSGSPDRPSIEMRDPGSAPRSGTETTGPSQQPRNRGRRGWFDGRGPDRATPADVEGLSERIEPSRTGRPSIPMNDVEPTQVMPTTRGGTDPTRRTDRPNIPMGDTSDDDITSEDIQKTFFPGLEPSKDTTPAPQPSGPRNVPEDKQLPLGEPKVVNNNTPTPAADIPASETPAKKERAPRKSKEKADKPEKKTETLDDVKKPKPEKVVLDDIQKPETKTETNDKPKDKPKGQVKIVDGVPTFVPDK